MPGGALARLSRAEIDSCRDAFLLLDKDRSGSIDIWELRNVIEGAEEFCPRTADARGVSWAARARLLLAPSASRRAPLAPGLLPPARRVGGFSLEHLPPQQWAKSPPKRSCAR